MTQKVDPQITSNIAIRTMDEEILGAVATLHFEVFSGYMNTLLGDSYVTEFLRWFQKAESAVALTAVDENGKLAGYILGAPSGYSRAISRDLFRVTASNILMRPWLWFNRRLGRACIERLKLLLDPLAKMRTETTLPHPIMSLVAIGVCPTSRGKGIALLLMRAFEDRARALKMQSMQLSVYPDNVAARHLYEHCGWQALVTPVSRNGTISYFRDLSTDR